MRLTSLDVFRGLTIAGMILANMASPAGEKNIYPPLRHADWHGCTFTDLVFPFFLFIVGVAMAFSFAKYTENSRDREIENLRATERAFADYAANNHPVNAYVPPKYVHPPYGKICRRAAILFALGLFLNGFWNQGIWTFDFSVIRLMGVLQRISLCYLFASLIVLKIPRRGQWLMVAMMLVGYWLAMMYIPVPEYGAGNLTRVGNFGAFIDRMIIPAAHLYKHDGFNNMGDPEGLFSTIPAIASTLMGYFTGEWIRQQPVQTRTSVGLVLGGIGCLFLGYIWGFHFPLNKKIWTSSYVLYTTGWALIFLAVCYYMIEVRRLKAWSKPFEIMGLNAIAIFVASALGIRLLVRIKIGAGEKAPNLYTIFYENVLVPWVGPLNGSLLFATITLLFWLIVAWVMYRQRWFIKI
ncbi:acyltransferase family protein [Calothrix sp. NIES-3974]|uniref:acyltransferase family protein n=1 Tax=Calothrix sp. NIES-3974 TaxID=2005462 RepID=UPI000B61014D|nr:heparan-alpha-glucosaminide N-acetyltransferase domain-containing protein [Calothrix sp. NIES-3974]BAZ07500.1 hypothetical protein NIES3974_41640 [Calothrix sp. NIES-3974]